MERDDLQEDDAALRARLAAIVDSSHDAIVSKTLDGIITTWNAAAERMFGYSAAEVIGRSITIVIPLERRDEETMVLSKIRAGQVVDHFSTWRRRKDGTLIPISLTVSPIRDKSGRVIGASKIVRDITDTLRIEEERRTLISQLQRTNQAKDEFLAMLGHELRNPLGVIASALEVQKLQKGPEAARTQEIIERQVRHLTSLVDDLLEVGRVVGGKISLEMEPIDLGAVVRAHVDLLRHSGTVAAHAVTCEATAPVYVRGDQRRLRQIVDNLISNAVKFTPLGGDIRLSIARRGERAVLEIADSGIGMSEELQRSAFELFVQGERNPDRREGGLGLGLTLVRRLVELHGGSIEVFSAGPNQGTRFTLSLPALLDVSPVKAPESVKLPAPPRRQIVVVEDNPDGREMLRSLLELSGHDVATAADGYEGVATILRTRPEVALIDIGLPGIDGYEVARRVRAGQDGSPPILVALTGYGQAADRQAGLAAGFDAYLTKPINTRELTRMLSGGGLVRGR